FSDSILARIHYLIRVNPKENIEYNIDTIENKIVCAARSWFDDLRDQAIATFGEVLGIAYFNKYKKAFTASYRESYSSIDAVMDIKAIETLTEDNNLALLFKPVILRETSLISLKLFHAEHI